MSISIKGLTPRLPSKDLRRTTEFISNQLGFSLVSTSRNECVFDINGNELRYWTCDDIGTLGVLAKKSGCIIYCVGLKEFYDQINTKDIVIEYPPKENEAGEQEMLIRDPHGNSLLFCEKK